MKKAAALSSLLAVVLLAVGVITQAQQPAKVSRIGYLSNTDPASESARVEGIRLALSERGYKEGQNISIDYRYAEGKPDRARLPFSPTTTLFGSIARTMHLRRPRNMLTTE